MTRSGAPGTLGDVLRQRGDEAAPAGITYVDSGGTGQFQTYRELLAGARRDLAVLRDAGLRPGDHAILLLTSSHEVLPAFWGCVLGGIVPTVLSVPRTLSRDTEPLRKLQHVWTLLDRPVVVLGDRHAAGLEGLDAREHPLPGVRCLTYGLLGEGDREAGDDHRSAPDDLAFLQFSSGSTGVPKGVRLTHANLLSNLLEMVPYWRVTPNDVFVNWMPESHDMGLICMHIHALYGGASQVKLPPLGFIREPGRLLAAVDRYRGTITAAPNFALALLLDRALGGDPPDVDLSSLRVFVNAAEPISMELMRRFAAACAPLGLRPEAMTCGYGLAEATVGVGSSHPDEPPTSARLDRDAFHHQKVVPAAEGDTMAVEVACLGRPISSLALRITDDDDRPLPDDCIGHVQFAGPTITSGYHGEREATAEAFCGRWLRTGDLGFTRAGELYVTGRVKDVIFVRGTNLYAADVEERVSELSALRPGEVVACGYTDWDSGKERLALFVKRRAKVSDDDLLELRRRLLDVLGVMPDAVLRVDTIPRTTSGKLQRHKLAEALQAEQLVEEEERWREVCRRHAARRRPASVEAALRAGEGPGGIPRAPVSRP